MNYLFEVIDKTGRKIHLSSERWAHITIKHPDLCNKLEDIKNTLMNPSFIIPQKYDPKMKNYYFYYKFQDCYLLVSVKYLNGNGFVATAFFTRKVVKRQ